MKKLENKYLKKSTKEKLTQKLRKLYDIKVQTKTPDYSKIRFWGKMVKVNAIFCPDCHTMIFSLHRHDYNECKCGKYMIDGGFDYLRCSVNSIACTIGLPVALFKEMGLDYPEKAVYDNRSSR